MVSLRSVTDLFGDSFFWASSATADFGTSTVIRKKRDSLRKSSGMSEAGTEASFASMKRIASALGSVLGCAKGEVVDLIAVLIEIPLYCRHRPAESRSAFLHTLNCCLS